MSALAAATSPIVIQDRQERLSIELDAISGIPGAIVAILDSGRTERMPISWSTTLITEGAEVERQPFGLAYADTISLSSFVLAPSAVSREYDGDDEVVTVSTYADTWQVDWEYRFRLASPRIEIQLVLSPREGVGTLRNVELVIALHLDDPDTWAVHAPGSGIRSSVPATAFLAETSTSESCFSGSGAVIVDRADPQTSILLWPFSRTEHSINRLRSRDDALELHVSTELAGRIEAGERLRWGSIEIDCFAETWDGLRPTTGSWFRTLDVAKPTDTASWIPGSSLFEVQIGTSVFWNGFEYSPYPTMRDLYDDLGRIAGLGFDVIQIMPRQPFPSYNVYDYADVTVSYGDAEDLKRVVHAAHALGMKVILDILMHGVIDADIIHRAADRVRSGPYFPRLNEGTEIVPDEEFLAYQGQDYLVSWSRHIIDFEQHWADGSPGSHPLVEEHPEWFVRDSAGEIIGVYTKAFDVSNPSWQDYFTESALRLMTELDIDGFRFDAPTYNEFPNWSKATEKRASRQQLGAVEYFGRLRERMKRLKPEAMLYTEPSGTLFRETMDITYNYDEHWLIHSVLRPSSALEKNPLAIRNARELAAWFRDKEAMLPPGAMTARHIDSHDTFWWPLPGFKWRREQYGLAATKALIAVWSLIGGSYMTFVGGETGVEDELRRAIRLRRELPEIRTGRADYDAVRASDDRLFCVARCVKDAVSLVLVNLANEPVQATVDVDIRLLDGAAPDEFLVDDRWNDISMEGPSGFVWSRDELAQMTLGFDAYQARVLTIHRAHR